ncbi:hypothetical protein [Rhizobium ruizarguesonis]|uniref:hypothetical protein n=1 Tax=Rhizobium ruizarguesonis TaxID=2081791 RepID=UPI001031F0B3|nr:hypothetical protein [Rhizobium ruizarguesonis]TAU29153.1 hypothetical protein ELI48_24980 [Rhizobium ruizarguesonis]TAU71153.1 hypothetical protein ELI45_26615 [Rhizobium ruizarguesonis]TAV18288.1 hypothetical protein ELI34_24305 [Rhizobium ruizarguesonis]TAV30528.1 hypothetical protein ELI35_24315 [Rhizobium ruizarguesonis]TAW12465.1 hypothetical protein ELI26_24455 [Rhizobium ruizarguesonis]
MAKNDPDWTATSAGHDWRDDELMLAVAWLKSFVPSRDMERRLDAAKAFLVVAREKMREGVQAPLYDPSDTAAWYILQAQTYATDRAFWTPEGVMRVAPFLTRIGKELPLLLSVKGAEERASRLMLTDRRQPDSGIYELLVAMAYRRGGWDRVEFVPETPGRGRTPDLNVYRPRSRWAVECKRLAPSPYAAREKLQGIKLAEAVHALSLEKGESVVVEVRYKIELADVPDDYLVPHVRSAIERRSLTPWDDEIASGRVRPVNWELTRKILRADYVYFGSSRMVELLAGYYAHDADHSMAAKWRPWPDRPEYADAVYHASVVTWRSLSKAAVRQKARHFRKILADAEGQLPPDRPGVIHIGIESNAGSQVDYLRHLSNILEARLFEPRNSRLRWVYGNYFVPEATTQKDESWAITETMVPYRIGSHRTQWPLPDHMLVSEEGYHRPGMHWDSP